MMLQLRLLAIVALVLGSLAALAPTLRPSLELPFLPDSRIHLGVALQGGLELVLEVDSEEAVREAVAGDVAFLGHEAAGALGGATVRTAGGLLEVVSEASQGDVVRFVHDPLLLGRYDHVESVGRVHRFELFEPRRQAIRERAVERIVERTWQRLAAEGCEAGSTVEHIGDALVAVAIPFSMDCLL